MSQWCSCDCSLKENVGIFLSNDPDTIGIHKKTLEKVLKTFSLHNKNKLIENLT